MTEVLTSKQFWELFDACKDNPADREALHHRYYVQFATDATRQEVKRRIGEDRIKASTDKWFNDIPLNEWDRMEGAIKSTISITTKRAAEPVANKPNHYTWSLGDAVCIAKAVAREIRGW